MRKIIIISFLLVAVAAAAWLFNNRREEPLPLVKVSYLCDGGKTIDAAFYKGEAIVGEPGEPPVSTGSVNVRLSDGREFDLPQTISADGIRYANQDETFVFWGKGNGALVLEDNVEKSYIGCIVVAPDPGNLPKAYANGSIGFSIRYLQDYSLNTSYQTNEFGPGKEISGVKLIIPESLATGTNLSSYDTGVSVEFLPATENCNASAFLFNENLQVQTIIDNGVEYSFASTTGAAAGNYYEEMIWAFPGANPCIALRYLIHSTNIQNYPPGVVREFDKTALLDQFDDIRHSLTLK